MSKGPSEPETREMLRLLHETYLVLSGMGRSGLSMDEAWPAEADPTKGSEIDDLH